MANCLVTKLKENVDNNLLPKLGSLIVKVTMNGAVNILAVGKPFYDKAHEVTMRIVQGDAFFANTAEAVSGEQSVVLQGMENNQQVYLHGADGREIYLSIDNYYYFARLRAVENSNDPRTWPIIAMDWDALKYSKIYDLRIFPNTGSELEVGTIGTLKESLQFASGKLTGGIITFDAAKANSILTPDFMPFTQFKNVDMAINALIYYKNYYQGYYNGPYYVVEGHTIPFADLPSDKKAAIYDALYYPLANPDNPNNLRQIFFLGSKYTVSNG